MKKINVKTLQVGDQTIVLDKSILDVSSREPKKFTPEDVLKAIKTYNSYKRDSDEIIVLNGYTEPLLEILYLRVQNQEKNDNRLRALMQYANLDRNNLEITYDYFNAWARIEKRKIKKIELEDLLSDMIEDFSFFLEDDHAKIDDITSYFNFFRLYQDMSATLRFL